MAKTSKRDRPRYLEPRFVEPGGHRANGDGLEQRLALFEVETPRRHLDDLVVPAATRHQIEGLLTKIRHHKVLYEDFGMADIDPDGGRTAINLYGPPKPSHINWVWASSAPTTPRSSPSTWARVMPPSCSSISTCSPGNSCSQGRSPTDIVFKCKRKPRLPGNSGISLAKLPW